MGITKAMCSPKTFWPNMVESCLVSFSDTLKQCTQRACVTMFVCRRLPQGMPVSPEDAQSLAREARQFLRHLFADVEAKKSVPHA